MIYFIRFKICYLSPNFIWFMNNKRRYFVIAYFCRFGPPNFGPISVRSLLYTLISLIFTPKYFLCLLPLFLFIYVIGDHVRGFSWGDEGGVTRVAKKCFANVLAKLFWRAIYCDNPRPDAGSQSGYWSFKGLGSRYPCIICKYDLVAEIVYRAT